MSLDAFRLLASRLFDHTYYLQLPFGFEPLIPPEFEDILRIIGSYAIRNVGVVTNGTMLSGAKAEALLQARSVTNLAVSLDGIKPDMYRALRGKPHVASPTWKGS